MSQSIHKLYANLTKGQKCDRKLATDLKHKERAHFAPDIKGRSDDVFQLIYNTKAVKKYIFLGFKKSKYY